MRAGRIVRALLLVIGAHLYSATAVACTCSQTGGFRLSFVDATTTQIVVAWQPVAGTAYYMLERSTSCDFSGAIAYTISPSITAYGDTGQPPDDRCRFRGNPGWLCWEAPQLNAGTAYTYRVIAASAEGEQISNCVTAQVASGPTRGVAGDLWADVVLGNPDFEQNALLKTTEHGVERPSGIVIDKSGSRRPHRVYAADVNHNRVLGFDHLGTCNGRLCTTDADCGGGTCVLDYPNLLPSVLLGQDSFTDKSACNGDSTGQSFPARAPASATSLCFVSPLQISMTETSTGSWMDTDDSGALYVPDIFNHRILRYADPFVSQEADTVLGQDDFAGTDCNKGRRPDCTSLCLWMQAGVAVDDAGNVWVSDTQNARVLRFPKCPASGGPPACSVVAPGRIAPEADVVLGQPDCTSNQPADVGRGLNQFRWPADVAFDRSTRTLYVTDLGNFSATRILAFRPDPRVGDFVTGMSGTAVPVQLPTGYPGTPPQLCDATPFEIAIDPQSHGLWVRGAAAGCVDLVDVSTGRASHTVFQMGPIFGIDADDLGNLFITDLWYGVLRAHRQSTGMGPLTTVFGGVGWSGDSFYNATGVAVLSDPAGVGPEQLVIGDAFRLLIWNTPDPTTLRNGQGADDVYGAVDFDDGSSFGRRGYYYPQLHRGRLWVEKSEGWPSATLLGFDYPLCGAEWQQSGVGCTQPSTPSRTIPLTQTGSFDGYQVLGSTAKVVANPPDAGDVDFAFTPAGDAVWVADRSNSRVFRIANLQGAGSPYVDVILGQANAAATTCNRGGGPRATTLCTPYSVSVDDAGNVFVGDNGEENGTNQRVLEFDASSLQTYGSARFGVPATRVYGTGGDFTIGWDNSLLSPFKPIIDPRGPMVVLNNAYTSQRFPVVYLDPLHETVPQFLLGDMTSYPEGSGFIDRAGNLYIPDTDWSRVLIYKNPLANLVTCGNGILEPGEQCDDGNSISGDRCSGHCESELIAGAAGDNECIQEWFAGAVSRRNAGGFPTRRLQCTDDDPLCDFGAATNDHACTFHLALCFNVTEQRFTCTASDVTRVNVVQPRAGATMAVDIANRTGLNAALAGLGGALRGLCYNAGPKRGQLCTQNSDCDVTPGSGKGTCKGTFTAFDPPLTTRDACGGSADVTVPLRRTRTGFTTGVRTLRVKSTTSKDPVTARNRTDTDVLTLVCKPHP